VLCVPYLGARGLLCTPVSNHSSRWRALNVASCITLCIAKGNRSYCGECAALLTSQCWCFAHAVFTAPTIVWRPARRCRGTAAGTRQAAAGLGQHPQGRECRTVSDATHCSKLRLWFRVFCLVRVVLGVRHLPSACACGGLAGTFCGGGK